MSSAFAAREVAITATDLGADVADPAWDALGQHAETRETVYRPELVDRETFDRLVQFRPVDMRRITGLAPGGFDFIWSACAFEHLGSLSAGVRFVVESMQLLKPGGIAVHTTEFNLSSDTATVEFGDGVIYRHRDIEALGRELRRVGGGLHEVDFDGGIHEFDIDYDYPPYLTHGRQHIKLLLDGFIATSILLIITRGHAAPELPDNRVIQMVHRLRRRLPLPVRLRLRRLRRRFLSAARPVDRN
jgi:hypothetical protein